jgi:hypothetical protein
MGVAFFLRIARKTLGECNGVVGEVSTCVMEANKVMPGPHHKRPCKPK